MNKRCLVIIVTYNSEKHIQWCIDGLRKINSEIEIRIVDSGSKETAYLDNIISDKKLVIIKEKNIGFVSANNRALYKIEDFDWVLFLNPDARIEGDSLEKLLEFASSQEKSRVAAITVPLVRYDIDAMRSLSVFDSVGISCNYYGRWVDIKSNDKEIEFHDAITKVEAICGAFMLTRVSALSECIDSTGNIGFERSYFMYKEDIELSQRFIKYGWDLEVYNKLTAFHCRGWNSSRASVPYWAKWHSATNDLDVAIKYKWRALPLALTKYIWVKYLEKK